MSINNFHLYQDSVFDLEIILKKPYIFKIYNIIKEKVMRKSLVLGLVLTLLLSGDDVFGMDFSNFPSDFPSGQYAKPYSFWMNPQNCQTPEMLRAKAVDFSRAACYSTDRSLKEKYGRVSIGTWKNYFEKEAGVIELDTLESALISYSNISKYQDNLETSEEIMKLGERILIQTGQTMNSRFVEIVLSAFSKITQQGAVSVDQYKRSLPFWDLYILDEGVEKLTYLSASNCYFEVAHSNIVEKIKSAEMSKAKTYFDRYLSLTEPDAVLPHAYMTGARIYQNLGLMEPGNNEQKEFFFQAVSYWREHFKDLSRIRTIDWGNAAQTFKSMGMACENQEESLAYFEESIRYYTQYLQKLKEERGSSYDALFGIANAYEQVPFWTNDEGKQRLYSDLSVAFFEKFKAQKEEKGQILTDEEKMHMANAYMLGSISGNLNKRSQYSQKYKSLLDENGWDCVFQIRSQIYIISKREAREHKSIQALTMVVEKVKASVEEEMKPSSQAKAIYEDGASSVADMVTQLDIKLQETKLEEPGMGAGLSYQKAAKIDDEIRSVAPEVKEPTISQLPKKKVKTRSFLTESKQALTRNETKIEYVVPSILRLQLQKAYFSTFEQQNAIVQMEWLESQCLGSIKERKALEYLKSLKRYFPASLTGHDFEYHPAHGNRNGDWDKGMTHRLKEFINDHKQIFLEVIKTF